MSHEAEVPLDPPERLPKPTRRTKIAIDLKEVLSGTELEKFQSTAARAQAPTLTEHFLNETIRRQSG